MTSQSDKPWEAFLKAHPHAGSWSQALLLEKYHEFLDDLGWFTVEDEANIMHPAILVHWTESERGWGQRPDGVSLHRSKEAAAAYIEEYWDRMPPRGPKGEVPDEYTFPHDARIPVMVNGEVWIDITEGHNPHGLRLGNRKLTELRKEGRIQLPEDLK